jgi:hypothetical protein
MESAQGGGQQGGEFFRSCSPAPPRYRAPTASPWPSCCWDHRYLRGRRQSRPRLRRRRREREEPEQVSGRVRRRARWYGAAAAAAGVSAAATPTTWSTITARGLASRSLSWRALLGVAKRRRSGGMRWLCPWVDVDGATRWRAATWGLGNERSRWPSSGWTRARACVSTPANLPRHSRHFVIWDHVFPTAICSIVSAVHVICWQRVAAVRVRTVLSFLDVGGHVTVEK